MRRLWVLVLAISLIIQGVTLSFAAYEAAQANILNTFTSASVQNTYSAAQKAEFNSNIQALKGIIADHVQREPGDIGDGAFTARTLSDFQTYLKGRLEVQNDPNIRKVIDDMDYIRSALEQKNAADNTDQSTLTALSGGAGPIQNADQNRQTASAQLQNAQTNGTPTGKCTSLFNASIVDCIDAGFTFLIKNTILQLAGFLVWLTANMLNFAIKTGILEFAQWAPNTLYPLWIIIRQIVSLAIVFAGLWLGFMYIIGREDTFIKYVGWVVIFALFVNFSYPITRAFIDVSNVVSLNIYTSSVGSGPLSGSENESAGALIMNKLGLQGLVMSATNVGGQNQKGFIDQIQSTPGALIAVVFVIYSAYIFFIATAILAVRTVVLVFLTVASPFLLIDSVVPKLGEVAQKMRKIYFEQLIVAPVFTIMLALTLRFMDIFQTPSGPLSSVGSGTASSLTASNTDSIKVFFGILMMLIMLHITLKVTKAVSNSVGEAATNWMGKVGGFGIGLATGGAGMLARGSIGAAAARVRDSSWMNNAQDSRLGRGLYTLSNSLAQSTYDARNIGIVSKGLATAGITGGMGVTAQQGLKQTYDQRFTAQKESISKRAAFIKDAGVRERYLDQMTKTPSNRAQGAFLGAVGKVTGLKEEERMNDAQLIRSQISSARVKALNKYNSISDPDKKAEYLDSLTGDTLDYVKRGGKAPDIKTGPVEGVAPTPSEKVDEATPQVEPQQATPRKGTTTIDTEHPGGSDMSQYESKEYEIPAVERKQMGPQQPANGIRTATKAREMTETEKVNMMNSYRAKFAQSRGKEGDAGATASTTPKPTTPPTGGTTTPEDRTSTV